MSCQYLFRVEFIVDDYELWGFPDDIDADEAGLLPTIFKFTVPPALCLEITEDEYIDQVNLGNRCVKSAIVSYDVKDLCKDLCCQITVFKIDETKPVFIGRYEIQNLGAILKQLVNSFISKVSTSNDRKCSENFATCDVKKELAPLLNENDCSSGTIFYTLRVTCCGQSVTSKDVEHSRLREIGLNQLREISSNVQEKRHNVHASVDKSHQERNFAAPSKLQQNFTTNSRTLMQNSKQDSVIKPQQQQPLINENYDEYSAQLNGNELIVRVRRDDPSLLVTRVFDNVDGKLSGDSNNKITLQGCGQTIDFNLPECSEICCKQPSQKQKRTCSLPIIRGNLKYPGKLNGKSINFNIFKDALKTVKSSTDRFRAAPSNTRNIAMQVNQNRISQQLDGVKKIVDKDGIEVCKTGSFGDCDVFIFKLGRKRIDKNGETSQIELEMRSPKGPDDGVKRMETREVQVLEHEFDIIGDRKKKIEESLAKVDLIDKKIANIKSSKTKIASKPPKKTVKTTKKK